jgi:hypothetical protein
VGSHQLPFGHRRDEIGNETYPLFPCCHILHLLLLGNWEDAQRFVVFVFAGLHVDTKEISYYLALPVLLDFKRAIVDDVKPGQLFQDIYLITQDRRYRDQLLVIRIVGEQNAAGIRVWRARGALGAIPSARGMGSIFEPLGDELLPRVYVYLPQPPLRAAEVSRIHLLRRCVNKLL